MSFCNASLVLASPLKASIVACRSVIALRNVVSSETLLRTW